MTKPERSVSKQGHLLFIISYKTARVNCIFEPWLQCFFLGGGGVRLWADLEWFCYSLLIFFVTTIFYLIFWIC